MTVMTAPRRRGSRHSQLPPHYRCMGCRTDPGKHDCLNNLSLKNHDLCDCSQVECRGSGAQSAIVTAPTVATRPFNPKPSMEVSDDEITSHRGKARPRRIGHDVTTET